MTGSLDSPDADVPPPSPPLSPASSVFATWASPAEGRDATEDPWPWSMPETDSHSEGFQSDEGPEGQGETVRAEALWTRLCALQHGLAEVERKISKHSSLQEARQQRCTRNRHRWVLQQRRQVPTRFRSLLPPGIAVGPSSPEVTPAPIAPIAGVPHRPKAHRGRAKVARSARPRRVARLLQQEATQPAFCLEETVPREDCSRYRFPLSRPSTSPRLRVNDYGNDVDAAVHGVVGDNDDVDEGDDQGIQKEEDMLRELQILSNSFQPDMDSSTSEEPPKSSERSPLQLGDHYLQHPSDPAYSRSLSHLPERRRSVTTDIQHDEIPLKVSDSGLPDLPETVLQDPQAQRPSTASKESKESAATGSGSSTGSQVESSAARSRPPRHAVFQDPVASDVSVPSRSHRRAVYGDLSSLGVSQEALASASVAQESSESDADVQQILKDFKDNGSSHVAFDDESESEDEESESEDSEDDDVILDKE